MRSGKNAVINDTPSRKQLNQMKIRAKVRYWYGPLVNMGFGHIATYSNFNRN